MKRILLSIFLAVIIIIPSLSDATPRTVTVSWTITDTTNILGYKIYYSNNSDMANMLLACDTDNPTATSLTCSNVDINTYPVYFILEAVMNSGVLKTTVKSVESPLNIGTVQDFKIVTPDVNQ